MPNIEIKRLCVTYQNKKKEVLALAELSTSFVDKSFNVIVGQSGCGKTTLLRCIAGMIDYEGHIYFDDIDSMSISPQHKNIAFVSQQYVLYPTMTIFDNIAFPLKNAKLPPKDIIKRVYDVADIFNLTDLLTRKPKQLSGGQQQRVAIARALVKNPSICLLDEPLSNIDAPERSRERQIIKESLTKSGSTIVYVTHDMREAMILADNLIVMDEGQIIACGKPLEVYESNNPQVNALFKAME
jgi:ABC-type sugar transport system ATPase subunit